MKRAPLAAAGVLLVLAGCASILDIPELEAPPSGALAEGGAESASGDACAPPTAPTRLTVAPRALRTAVDDKDVYFTRGGGARDNAILRCSKCGCTEPSEVAGMLGYQPAGIAVDEKYVFWTDSSEQAIAMHRGSLNRVAKDDLNQRQTFEQIVPFAVTSDEEFVYWTVIGDDNISTSGIWRARKSDFTDPTRLARVNELPDNLVPYAIAVDATHVYYTTTPDLDETDSKAPCKSYDDAGGAVFGTVRRVLKRGPALQKSEVLATGQACPVGLALSGDAVFWSNLGINGSETGSVWTRPKNGDLAKQLVPNVGRPTSLVFHTGRVVWNDPFQMKIESCTPPACTDFAKVATAQQNPSGLGTDGTSVYWAVLGDVGLAFANGGVWRAPVPSR